jgi:hypothetical protein
MQDSAARAAIMLVEEESEPGDDDAIRDGLEAFARGDFVALRRSQLTWWKFWHTGVFDRTPADLGKGRSLEDSCPDTVKRATHSFPKGPGLAAAHPYHKLALFHQSYLRLTTSNPVQSLQTVQRKTNVRTVTGVDAQLIASMRAVVHLGSLQCPL